MRIQLLAALIGLAAGAGAQKTPTTEGLQIFPGRGNDGTSFISRLGVPNSAGKFEALAEYPKAFLEGLGDVSTQSGVTSRKCELAHLIYYYQDQDPGTSHNYDLVIRTENASGTPDVSANSEVFRINNLQSPTFTGTSPVAIGSVHTFMSNGKPKPLSLPCDKSIFMGMALNPNSKWVPSNPTDGLSVYVALYDPVAGRAKFGDNVAPRTNVPNLSWRVTGAGAAMTASNKFDGMVIAYMLISDGPMLQVGAVHTSSTTKHGSNIGFGAAGLYPTINDSTRKDGLAVRITDNANAKKGAEYFLFLSLTTLHGMKLPPIHLDGVTGNVYLGSLGLIPLAIGSKGSVNDADTVITLAPPGTVPVALVGSTLWFQALTAAQGSSTGGLTNMAAVRF